jgi:hypothetical protein
MEIDTVDVFRAQFVRIEHRRKENSLNPPENRCKVFFQKSKFLFFDFISIANNIQIISILRQSTQIKTFKVHDKIQWLWCKEMQGIN